MSKARIALGAIATLAGAGAIGFVIGALQVTTQDADATWLWIGAIACFVVALMAGAAWWVLGATRKTSEGIPGPITTVRIVDGRIERHVVDLRDKADGVGISDDAEVPSRLPERESRPLKIVGSNHDDTNNTRFLRLQIHNPNNFGVADCYAKVLSCSGAAKETYKGPPIGYHFPWSTYGGNGKIAPMSDDYLDIAWVAGREAKKCAVAYKNDATQKLEAHHMMNRDTYEITMEVGSKTSNIPLERYEMSIIFGGGFDLEIEDIRAVPTADTAVSE